MIGNDLTDSQVLRSNVLLHRIQTDFNPREFTIKELRGEIARKSTSSDGSGSLRINVAGNLAILIDRGLVEELSPDVYALTDEGEKFDFVAWIRTIEYGESDEEDG